MGEERQADERAVVRRLENAAHEIAIALSESIGAGVPVRLQKQIATVAFKAAVITRKVRAHLDGDRP